MILTLFGFFLALSIILIVIGLAKPEETGMAIIGFVFMFLLSFTLINNNLEYHIGEQKNTSYVYSETNLEINYTIEDTRLIYATYTDNNSHTFGYWLAVISFLGFLMCVLGLKGEFRRGE